MRICRSFEGHPIWGQLLCARAVLGSCDAEPRPVAGREGAWSLEGWIDKGRRPEDSPALAHTLAFPAWPALSCSVAKSLGAKTVAARALACMQELEIISEVVEDVEAVSAVQQFLGE